MDREEFLQLTLEAEATLFHISFSILHDEQDCADAVQEGILKAYMQRNKLREIKYFKTWLVRIVINECYGMLRRNCKLQRFEENIVENKSYFGNYIKEEYLDLYQAISRLEEKEKICILLFYMEDYSVAEIADVLKIPVGTVKSRLNRGRKKLKDYLDE